MYEIKKIYILRIAIFSAISAAASSLLVMAFYAVMFLLATSRYYNSFWYSALLPILLVPVVAGAIGFGAGALSAFIYNIAASYIGGIKMDINYIKEENNQTDLNQK